MFLVTWSPYLVTRAIRVFDIILPSIVYTLSIWIIHVNAVGNFIIYARRGHDYRQAFLAILKRRSTLPPGSEHSVVWTDSIITHLSILLWYVIVMAGFLLWLRKWGSWVGLAVVTEKIREVGLSMVTEKMREVRLPVVTEKMRRLGFLWWLRKTCRFGFLWRDSKLSSWASCGERTHHGCWVPCVF